VAADASVRFRPVGNFLVRAFSRNEAEKAFRATLAAAILAGKKCEGRGLRRFKIKCGRVAVRENKELAAENLVMISSTCWLGGPHYSPALKNRRISERR
jgi:hypothetical protein